MKTFRWLVVLATMISFAVGSSARAQAIAISVNVTGSTDVDREQPSARSSKVSTSQARVDVTQDKQLEITLVNRSSNPFANLSVQYYVFGSDVANKEIVILSSGKETANVAGPGRTLVKSGMVKASYTRAYVQKNKGKSENIPASGQKYAGYGVQVFLGNKLLAEIYDPPEMKAKAANAAEASTHKRKKQD